MRGQAYPSRRSAASMSTQMSQHRSGFDAGRLGERLTASHQYWKQAGLLHRPALAAGV